MKKLLLFIAACCSFAIGYGVVAEAYPAGGMYGRGEYRGYFTNSHDTTGTFILPKQYTGNTNAINPTVNNATELINFLKGSEGLGGNNQQRTGASFIIQTMIGSARNRPPTAGQIAEWESRVRYAESTGRISWFVSYSFCINSFYQGVTGGGSPNDDAFFDDCQTNTSIVFRDASGAVAYVIKRECANPVGNVRPIPDAPPAVNWNAEPRSAVSNASPLPGQTITFTHRVRNEGPTATGTDHVWAATLSHPSNAIIRGGHDTGTYTNGQEKVVDTQNVTIPAGTPAGTQICQKLSIDWGNSSGERNELGLPACATVRYDFGLTPNINPVIATSDGLPPTDGIAEQGDSVTFTYSVTNNGTTQSQTTNCAIFGLNRTNYYAVPTPNDTASDAGYSAPPTTCPQVFPYSASGSTTNIATETVALSTTNRSVCRVLRLTPARPDGSSASTEVCVYVASKPYARVYGGDVTAGNGLTTSPGSCVTNNAGAIVGWNRGDATFRGAGTQFAAFAMGIISHFTTSLGNGASAAPRPSGLSFANTSTNVASGNFGGSLGSVPCIPDHYGGLATAAGVQSIGASIATSPLNGIYSRTGNTTLNAGNVTSNQRVVIYIDGNLFITGSGGAADLGIAYTGSWNPASVPLFQVVVRGDIFIGNNIGRLDGIYVAQKRADGSGGTIHTCATGFSALALDGGLYNNCNKKLTINGAFVANQVRLLRTAGTLSQSDAAHTPAASTAGEVFNYNPTLWMAQPPRPAGEAGDYDAIISLPPVL